MTLIKIEADLLKYLRRKYDSKVQNFLDTVSESDKKIVVIAIENNKEIFFLFQII